MELKKLSEQAIPQFQEGISLLLSRWSALQMAVDNEWGGPNSRSIALQLASDIFNWFALSKELYIDDLEALLDDTMITLNTEAQDGSIEEIAEKLMIMHEECLEGNFGSIEKLRQAIHNTMPVRHIEQVANDDESTGNEDVDDVEDMDDEGASKMKVDAPTVSSNLIPEQAVKESRPQTTDEADGWVTVTSRKNRSRKN
ncbi:hypothetical protein Ancab_024048 [Ancistrocladus abbreviatus]